MLKRLSLDKGKKKKDKKKKEVANVSVYEQKIFLFCRQYLCNI